MLESFGRNHLQLQSDLVVWRLRPVWGSESPVVSGLVSVITFARDPQPRVSPVLTRLAFLLPNTPHSGAQPFEPGRAIYPIQLGVHKARTAIHKNWTAAVCDRRRANSGTQLAIKDIRSVDSTSTRRGFYLAVRAPDWSA